MGRLCRIAGYRLAGAGLLLGALLPVSSQAFYVDGFWSGMSPQQIVATAAAYGLTARPGMSGQWFIGTANTSLAPARVLGEFGFCGNYLVSYTRNIHSDADYANTLAALFATYGPPRKMNFSGDVAAAGSAAGAFRASGETEWRRGADRVLMASDFDWRLYQGALRREQPARVRYETLNPCSRF